MIYQKFTRILFFIIPLFSVGVCLEPANAFRKSVRSGIVSPRIEMSSVHSRSELPTMKGLTPRSKVPQTPHKTLKIPPNNSTVKRPPFQFSTRPFPSAVFYPPITTPDYSESTPSALPADNDFHELRADEQPGSAEVPHPLVIELRCGKYVRVPWPESSILYSEESEEERCSESK